MRKFVLSAVVVGTVFLGAGTASAEPLTEQQSDFADRVQYVIRKVAIHPENQDPGFGVALGLLENYPDKFRGYAVKFATEHCFAKAQGRGDNHDTFTIDWISDVAEKSGAPELRRGLFAFYRTSTAMADVRMCPSQK
jgi:hypothetical protein